MFQFRIGRIPVEVHFSHAIISALIAFALAPRGGLTGDWPGGSPGAPVGSGSGTALGLAVLMWMAIISLSVLVHELGHAVAAQLFGYRSRIQLIGLGGLTHTEGAETMPWYKDVLYTLAGPTAGLTLGILAGASFALWQNLTSPPELARSVLLSLFWANLAWTVLNLIPVSTLDGGRIAAAVLTRVLGRPGFLVAQGLSLLLVGAVLVVAAFERDPFLAGLMVLLGLRTVANISAYSRGELPLGDGAHPLLALVQRGEQLYREGSLPEARQVALEALQASPPALVRSRAHFLLGWVALKAGEGRPALDHFAQVQGLPIPPQAAAAAFTLLGDEQRALPMWAEAVRANPGDPVVLHEFAGALLRAGREAEVRRLPGIRLALAFAAAERVHYVRGEYGFAAQMAEAAFREAPSATAAYDAACAWARAGEAAAALRMLTLASQNGFDDDAAARADPDLVSLHDHPGFQAWLQGLGLASGSGAP